MVKKPAQSAGAKPAVTRSVPEASGSYHECVMLRIQMAGQTGASDVR
jgi:hypothetical protein